MFEKSLQDLVKGIRSHKRDPSAFISQSIQEIKLELRNTDPFIKAQVSCLSRPSMHPLLLYLPVYIHYSERHEEAPSLTSEGDERSSDLCFQSPNP